MSSIQTGSALIAAVQQAKQEATSASRASSAHDYVGLARDLSVLDVALSKLSNVEELKTSEDWLILGPIASALNALADRLDGMTNAHEVDKMPAQSIPGPLSHSMGKILDALIELFGGEDVIGAIS